MTPAEEAGFIRLRTAGWETAAIAERLGLKATTAQSRAYHLQQKGLIQPRPRGGAYPSQKALARQGPVHRPVHGGAEPALKEGADPVQTGAGRQRGGLDAAHRQSPVGTWQLTLPNTEEMKNRFKNAEIDDILLVFTYAGRTPAWPA